MSSLENITQHIIAYAKGDAIELNIIIDLLYTELCKVAQNQLNRLNSELISSQELVHEVYLKFSKSTAVNANDRKHFLSISAMAMRQLVVDQLRTKISKKQGGNLYSLTLTDNKTPVHDNNIEILSVNKAIDKLKTIEPKLAMTVECRYFAGYTEQETALAIGVNVRTVRRYWSIAKRYLEVELK